MHAYYYRLAIMQFLQSCFNIRFTKWDIGMKDTELSNCIDEIFHVGKFQ